MLRAAARAESDAAEDWLRRTPLKPGVSILRNFPSIERWVLDVVRHGDYDDYWKQRGYSIEEHYDEYADVPVCLLSGWYDTYTRATVDNFVELGRRKRGPVRMIIGPWTTASPRWARAGRATRTSGSTRPSTTTTGTVCGFSTPPCEFSTRGFSKAPRSGCS